MNTAIHDGIIVWNACGALATRNGLKLTTINGYQVTSADGVVLFGCNELSELHAYLYGYDMRAQQ